MKKQVGYWACVASIGLAAGDAGAARTMTAGAGVDRAALMQSLDALAGDGMEGRQTGSAGAARARAYIAERFASMGLEVETASFAYVPRSGEEKTGTNMWAQIRGTEFPDRWIVVTAHYDHVGIAEGAIHNGADDNASGVSVLLEIARALKRAPTKHSVLLVALDAEEPVPGMFGAKAFVEAPPVPIDALMLNINMDMVARQDGGALWAAGTRSHRPLKAVMKTIAGAAPLRLRLGHDKPDTGSDDWTMLSDHAPFHARGIPFIYFGVEDHADYHGPGDDVDKIDPDFFGRSADTILMSLRQFDAAPKVLAKARERARGRE